MTYSDPSGLSPFGGGGGGSSGGGGSMMGSFLDRHHGTGDFSIPQWYQVLINLWKAGKVNEFAQELLKIDPIKLSQMSEQLARAAQKSGDPYDDKTANMAVFMSDLRSDLEAAISRVIIPSKPEVRIRVAAASMVTYGYNQAALLQLPFSQQLLLSTTLPPPNSKVSTNNMNSLDILGKAKLYFPSITTTVTGKEADKAITDMYISAGRDLLGLAISITLISAAAKAAPFTEGSTAIAIPPLIGAAGESIASLTSDVGLIVLATGRKNAEGGFTYTEHALFPNLAGEKPYSETTMQWLGYLGLTVTTLN